MVLDETPVWYSQESELLQKAISGERSAVESFVEQLASPYPRVKQKMLEALHSTLDSGVWLHLLNCLASGKWSDDLPLDITADPGTAQQLDISIVEAFVEDFSEAEEECKNAVIRSIITSQNISLRNAGAYLAGLRGDAAVIPILSEMLERGSRRWQLRAIRALSAIPSTRSAALLVQILVNDHDLYHQEARQGLSKLGQMAIEAWEDALDHSDPHIRWHAARGLAENGEFKGLSFIAEALGDENSTVRWVSSDLLAQIGIQAVPTILEVLVRKPLSDECRQSAYHALLSIKTYRAQEILKPLVSALSSPSTKLIAQIIAERMKNDWGRLESYLTGGLQSLDSMKQRIPG